jgi:signal transduction histidine kinase
VRDLKTLQANRGLLVALISNLLGNAIKFSPAGGRVDVVAIHANNLAIIEIVDLGIGMSEYDYDMEHLFEKFYRGSTAKDAGVRGTGLGLVLITQAVEVHGETVSVESQLGRGTCFNASLPLGDGGGATLQGTDLEGVARLPDPMLSTNAGTLLGAWG